MAGLMADILDQSGVPYCKGGVMARNALWRGSLPAWRARVEEWIGRKRPEDLLNVDIFFDAMPVHGDAALGDELLSYAYARGAERPTFWRALGETLLTWRSPVGLFGGLRTEPNGRLDLKRYGLLPLFTAARIVAIRTNSPRRSTPERLQAAPAHDLASPDSVERMIAAQGVLLDAMLRQQLADSRAGIAPSPRVDPRILGKRERAALADALRQVPRAIDLVREGML
jgi:DNA polymerase-3 subunit epsilon/CBS domain-containing protein